MWYIIRIPPWYVDTTYIPGTSLLHPTLKPRHFLLRCRLQLTYRFFNTKTKISRTHCRRLLLYRLLLRYRRYSFGGGDVSIRTRFARIIRYDHSLYVLRSRASRSRCSIPGISGRVDMITSPVPAARAAVATGGWVESKHMYLIHTWK